MTEQKVTAIAKCARSAEELFTVGKYKTWKPGEISKPRWLRRENGFDFIALTEKRDLLELEKYLAKDDLRLAVESYNTFTTGRDKNLNPMIVMNHMDEDGNTTKRAIIVCNNHDLAIPAVELVEHFCQEDGVSNAQS